MNTNTRSLVSSSPAASGKRRLPGPLPGVSRVPGVAGVRPAALAVAAAVALMMSGCASAPPPNSELDAARTAYQAASSDPNVGRVAPDELRRAAISLQQAEEAWKEKQDPAEVTHLAYLARDRAELASSIGAQHGLEDQMRQAAAERDKIRIEARAREAQMERERAEMAQAQAQAAQQQAQNAQAQAESSQQQAEMARQQAMAERERVAAAERQAADEAAKSQKLQQELQGLQTKADARGMVVTLGDVVFDTGKADLQEGGRRAVARLASVLKEHPERKVLVEGFTDSTGSPGLNMALSEERADAVRAALVSQGVPSDRIITRGYGEAYPVAGNQTPAGRQLNRRVEIVFSDANGNLPGR